MNWEKLSDIHREYKNYPNPLAETGMIRGFSNYSNARVMDIGANIGIFSAHAAMQGAKVFAYEADPVTFVILSDMIAAMKLDVTAYNKAVWTQTGECSFRGFTSDDENGLTHNGGLAVFSYPENGKFRSPELTPCVSLNDAIGQNEWDCVKVDIEGGEFELLMSASDEQLSKVKFMYIEVHHDWATKDAYIPFVSRLEKMFLLDGNKFSDGRWDWICAVNRQVNGLSLYSNV